MIETGTFVLCSLILALLNFIVFYYYLSLLMSKSISKYLSLVGGVMLILIILGAMA